MADDRTLKPDPRRERLEAQLRENLKRRKEQARARREHSKEGAADGATLDDEQEG